MMLPFGQPTRSKGPPPGNPGPPFSLSSVVCDLPPPSYFDSFHATSHLPPLLECITSRLCEQVVSIPPHLPRHLESYIRLPQVAYLVPLPARIQATKPSLYEMISFAAAAAILSDPQEGRSNVAEQLAAILAEESQISVEKITERDLTLLKTSATLQRKILQHIPGFESDSDSVTDVASSESIGSDSDSMLFSGSTVATSTRASSPDGRPKSYQKELDDSSIPSSYTTALSPPPWHRQRRLTRSVFAHESTLFPVHKCSPCGSCDHTGSGSGGPLRYDL